MSVFNTRLRYVSSRSPERLAAFISQLPFKVEIKSIVAQGNKWFCWFVLPDNITYKELEIAGKQGNVDLPVIDLEF